MGGMDMRDNAPEMDDERSEPLEPVITDAEQSLMVPRDFVDLALRMFPRPPRPEEITYEAPK